MKEVLSKFVPSITQPAYMYTVEITALMTFTKRPVICTWAYESRRIGGE